MTLPDTHLDLGCGAKPRNPYGRANLFGVDIRELPATANFESRAANLAIDPIPYADNTFGSVSAFDFIEHVPRVLGTADGRSTRMPFIELMNEVWRVLAPGGRLFAVTPAFPQPEVFVDPTHVNFITERTHLYFCGEAPMGRMYGFDGQFRVIRVEWVHHHENAFTDPAWETRHKAEELRRKPQHPARRMATCVREFMRFLRGKRSWKAPHEHRSHLLWELEAIKQTPAP